LKTYVAGLGVPTPPPPSTIRRAVRYAWRCVVRAMQVPPLAALMAANVVALVLVFIVMYRVMQTLQQVVCVIGGEDLLQCLR